MARTRVLADLNNGEICPEPGNDVEQFARKHATTIWHPAGTCKMGRDAMAVVDPRLRVYGLDGLRVVDASIMPVVTSGNTHAPCVMIAEKAADMILAEAWQGRENRRCPPLRLGRGSTRAASTEGR